MQQNNPDIRTFLIAIAFQFIDRVITLPGIRRVAIIGSITSAKPDPKDVDILITVEDAADLTALAAAARRLKGIAQSRNKGADIFLANPSGQYVGRICHWRMCGPGIRASCDAQHCGQRHFLHDDFGDIRLDKSLVMKPPIEVWPTLICRVAVVSDLLPYITQIQSEKRSILPAKAS